MPRFVVAQSISSIFCQWRRDEGEPHSLSISGTLHFPCHDGWICVDFESSAIRLYCYNGVVKCQKVVQIAHIPSFVSRYAWGSEVQSSRQVLGIF